MFMIHRTEEAVSPLRETWERAESEMRDAIIHASARIDQTLGNKPHEQGESRGGKVRILLEAPVGVLFEVDKSRGLVRILRSWAWNMTG